MEFFMSRNPTDFSNISFKLQKRLIELINDEDYINNKKCSNSEFAKRVGVNKSVISNIVNYGIIPSVKSLIKIADYLNVSLKYLLGETDKNEFIKSDNPTTFHFRLKELIDEKNYKISQITNANSFARNSIHVWLKRKNLPSLEYLNSLANTFNVTADYLLGRTDFKN